MEHQENLFGPVYEEHPPHNDTDTSIAAAKKQIGKAAADRARILAFLGFMPATDEEIHRNLKMEENTVRPRRGELVEAGKVIDSGKRRKTRTGSPAIVWRVK
jgi:transcription initiation factor IIE alpha subunit